MESSKQIEQTAALWLAKRTAGNWSDADEAELNQWLQASTANRVAFIRLNTAWQRADRLKALGAGMPPGVVPAPGEWRFPPAFRSTQAVSSESPKVPSGAPASSAFLSRFRAIAASIVLAIALGVGWYLWPSGPSYRTAVGGLASVPMSDGSKATLNTDSEIRVTLTESERRVSLKHGEAFFEVAKDPARPFVVVAGDKRIVAVGTMFSVHRDADDLRVVVTEGRVRLEQNAQGREPVTQLPAGSVATASGAGVHVRQRPLPELDEYLSWRSGYLVFRDTTLADAVAELNRYNTRRIVIADQAVAAMRIGGSFRSTNVEAFARLLEAGYPVNVERRDDTILVTLSN